MQKLNIREYIFYLVAGAMLSLLYSCDNYSISENQTESFIKYFPIGIENNMGNEVIQTLNGGYVILSNFSNQGVSGSDRDIPVIFCDEFGRQSNNSPVMVGTSGIDLGNSIITDGNGYIIAGSTTFSKSQEGLLMKIGSEGQIIWQKNYHGYKGMEFREIIRSNDGGYIVTGSVRNAAGEQKVILFKTDQNGDSTWMTMPKGYTGFDDVGESVIEYKDRIIIVGTTSSVGATENDRLLILNVDDHGSGDFPLKVSGEQNLSGKKIIKNFTEEIYILGNDVHELSGSSQIFIARIELTDGGKYTEIRESTYLDDPGSVFAYDLKIAAASTMAVCGWKIYQNDYNIFFGIVDSELKLTQSRSFGSKGYQSAYGLYFTGDEGYALTGTIDLGGGRTSLLLKLDSGGELR